MPAEPAFLFGFAYLDQSQAFIQPMGIRVIFLDAEIEGDADRCGLCLEVLDDSGAYAVALDSGKKLNAAELNAVGGAGDPQPADALAADLDHADGAAGDLGPDLLHRRLTEARTPSPFVEVVREAALGPRGLDDHIGEKPHVFGGGQPYAVNEHESMLSPVPQSGVIP